MIKKLVTLLLCLSMVFCLVSTSIAVGGISNFKQVKTYNRTFTDTPETEWFYKYVKSCYEYNIILGTTTETYSPEEQLSVCQTIVVAARVHSIYATGKNSLDSIAPGKGEEWYMPYVNYAIANKLIGKNDFSDYDKPVTRAEAVHIFSNVLPDSEYTLLDGHKSVPGMDQKAKYYKEVLKFYNFGIVNGVNEQGHFDPDAYFTRAQGATLFARILFPSLRVGFTSFQTYSVESKGSTVSLKIPNAYTEDKNGGRINIEATNENVLVSIDMLADKLFADMSITDMFTLEEIKDFYEVDFSQGGDDFTFISCEPTAIKYGSTNAYCVKTTLEKNDSPVFFYNIIFTHGETLFEFIFSGTLDSGTLLTMVNSLSVMGSGANIVF